MSQIAEFPAKSPAGKKVYPFDFTSQLAAGETVASGVGSIAVWSGTDANPSIMLPTPTGSVVTPIFNLVVQGGLLGVIYLITATVTTSLGNILTITALLAITQTPL